MSTGKRGNPGWQKGTSGNPGGRRKQDYRIKDLAQEHTELALRRLAEIAENTENLGAAVAAATALLDRGWGKPAQSVDMTHASPDGGPVRLVING